MAEKREQDRYPRRQPCRIGLLAVSAAVMMTVLLCTQALAQTTIDPNNDSSRYAWGENVGWINFKPNGDTGPGVAVTANELRGYAWGENVGWISFSCLNTNTCGSVDYGVDNDGAGNLSGWAWGENVGWISFSCVNTNSCATVDFGVTISPSTGVFAGEAWGENIGWINFSSTGPVAFGVKTSPFALPVTRTLNVASVNPPSGVVISVSPDTQGNRTTPFQLTYGDNALVELTAPLPAPNGNVFQKWQRDGSDHSLFPATQVTMDADHTMTAIYAAPLVITRTLSVNSSNPNSGVTINASKADNAGHANGITHFDLIYNDGTSVNLTAPTTAPGGNNFSTWSGCDSSSGATCTANMSADKTVTAVYVAPPSGPRTLTVSSLNPNSGVNIKASLKDKKKKNKGTTRFELIYDNNTSVTLTAPLTAGGNNFSTWSGCDSSSGTTCTANMSANKTVTAVYLTSPTQLLKDLKTNQPKKIDDRQVAGLLIEGPEPMTVLIRARGPSLADFGISTPMADPLLRMFLRKTLLAQNDNWQDNPSCNPPATNCGGAAQIATTGLDPCRPTNLPGHPATPTGCSKESAILATLPPGGYTLIVTGTGGPIGAALIEAFDVGGSGAPVSLLVINAGSVGVGATAVTDEFIVRGTNPKNILIRARGPSLKDFKVKGPLADPFLKLFSGTTLLAQNDNWQTTDPLCVAPATDCGGVAQIVATNLDPCRPTNLPGHPATPTGCTQESAILATLSPGGYKTVVSGVGGGKGMGLVEVFEIGTTAKVDKFFPTEGTSGVTVVINGSGFSPNVQVTFGGVTAAAVAVNSQQIVTLVPFAKQGATAVPMSAGQVSVAMNGTEIGTFNVQSLPTNPNTPGVVWDSAAATLVNEFPGLRAALTARIDALLPIATTPELIDLLNATKDILPLVESDLQKFPALKNSLPPDALDLLERFLLRQGASVGASSQAGRKLAATSLVPNCNVGTSMDQTLCRRKKDADLAENVNIIADACAYMAAGLFLIPPLEAAGVVLGEVCTEISLIKASLKLLLDNKELVDVKINGPDQLRIGDKETYLAEVTLQNRQSMDSIDTGTFELVMKVLQALKILPKDNPFRDLLIDKSREAAHIKFDDIPLDQTSRPVSGGNFDWRIFEDPFPPLPVAVNELGEVTVGDFDYTAARPITLGAELKNDLKTNDERKGFVFLLFTPICDWPWVGCKEIKLIPNITLDVKKVGTSVGVGSGRVTSDPPGIDCGPVCKFDFPEGQVVTLTAQEDSGSTFKGWSGLCFGTETTCTKKLEGSPALTAFASFEPTNLDVEQFVGFAELQGTPFNRGECVINPTLRQDLIFTLSIPDSAGNVKGVASAPVNYFESSDSPGPCTIFSHLFGGVGDNPPAWIFDITATVENFVFNETGMVADANGENSHAVTVTFTGKHLADSIAGKFSTNIEGIPVFSGPITATLVPPGP